MPREVVTPEEEAEESGAAAEPTHSQTRPRRPGEAGVSRTSRTSVRPSAFGLPRPPYSAPPPAPERLPPLAPALTAVSSSPAVDDDAHTTPSLRIRNGRSRVVDQLSEEIPAPPLSKPVSMPPRAPSFSPVEAAPAAHRTRRPWGSIALFCGMLGLSVIPLARYARTREPAALMDQPSPQPIAIPQPIVTSTPPPAAAQDVEQAEAEAKAAREQQLSSLVTSGTRALEAGSIPEAERLFGRVIELDEDNPRAAFGLARIRLSQGNLTGAEGWIQQALRKRPHRRAYHALYAEILGRLGRTAEAHEEETHAGDEGDD